MTTGDRVYATETIELDDDRIVAGTEGIVIETAGKPYVVICWDTGYISGALVEEVAHV